MGFKNLNLDNINLIRSSLYGNCSFLKPLILKNNITPENFGGLFDKAKQQFQEKNNQECIEELNNILKISSLNSRYYIQAWNFLRELGIQPSIDVAKKLYGIVFEINMNKGFDFLGVYSDQSALYYNYNGKAILFNDTDESVRSLIRALLYLGNALVGKIGLWNDAYIPLPVNGRSRVTMLTPAGLYFGEGILEELYKDKSSEQLMIYGTKLLEQLTTRKVEK